MRRSWFKKACQGIQAPCAVINERGSEGQRVIEGWNGGGWGFRIVNTEGMEKTGQDLAAVSLDV